MDPKSDRNSDRTSCLCKVFNEPIVLIVLKTHCDWLVLELSIRFGSFDPKLNLLYGSKQNLSRNSLYILQTLGTIVLLRTKLIYHHVWTW